MRSPPLAGVVSPRASFGACDSARPGRDGAPIAELRELGAANPARREEFLRGRIAARRALSGLGLDVDSIPIGAWRQPVWPPRVVGSISHCPGLGVAAVARAADLRGIGVDVAAADRRLSAAAVRRIVSRPERWALSERAEVPWPLVLFCLKEAAFKAVFQAYGRRLVAGDLAFERPPAEARAGRLECLLPRPRRRLRGHYAFGAGFLVTCVELTREDAPLSTEISSPQ